MTAELLTPLREVIAVNQDPLGVQGRLVKSMDFFGEKTSEDERGRTRSGRTLATGNSRVYSRPLKNGDVAVALLYVRSFATPRNISFTFKEVGLKQLKDYE